MPQVLEKSHLKKRTRLAPEVRKQLILDAALTEFSERGYDGASTTLIAKRAGLAQAGIYAHFKSKEDILGAYFLRYSCLVGLRGSIQSDLWMRRL